MTADDVKALVLNQIGGGWAEKNLHGIRVAESVISPSKVEMIYPAFRNGERIEHLQPVWLILEECDDGTGYKIVFDEEDSMFALATPGKAGKPAIVVSSYATFLDAFKAM
jgi:hypothetical protein